MSLHRAACCCDAEPITVLKAVWCGTSPASCDWTTAPPLYFRATTLCTGTEDPIEPGHIIFYRGLCYVLTDDFTPPDPLFVEDADEVECIGTGPTCEDGRCTGPWYYAAFACEHHEPTLCVLVEYCDAQAIFAAANVPGERAVDCIVFAVDGKCYQLRPDGFIGYVGDTTDCTIISSIGTWYKSCCHCSSEQGGQQCASSEHTDPTHHSTAAPLCWRGNRQGACCGSRYSVVWSFKSHVELYSDGSGTNQKYRDDTIEHSGNFIVGPPTPCPGSPGNSGMAIDCSGTFNRVLIDGYGVGAVTHTYTPSLCDNWASADELVVRPPIGCKPGGVYAIVEGACALVGSVYSPTGWVSHVGGPATSVRFLSNNGHSIEDDCEHSDVQTSSSGGIISERLVSEWSITNGAGSGSFHYKHELYTGSPLIIAERVEVDATYFRTTIAPCERCKAQANPFPGGGGDSMDGGPGNAMRGGCGDCGRGGGDDEPTEVL